MANLSGMTIPVKEGGQIVEKTYEFPSGGSGSGDMTKAVYDPNNAVANAGGIAAYTQDLMGNAYKTNDSTNSTINDNDYIPFYDITNQAPKKITYSNLFLYKVESVELREIIATSTSVGGQVLVVNFRGMQSESYYISRYLQSSSKTTSNGIDTFTFTNSNITSSADYDVSANVFGVAPVDMVLSGTTMQVKFDSSDNVTSCRLYIK